MFNEILGYSFQVLVDFLIMDDFGNIFKSYRVWGNYVIFFYCGQEIIFK